MWRNPLTNAYDRVALQEYLRAEADMDQGNLGILQQLLLDSERACLGIIFTTEHGRDLLPLEVPPRGMVELHALSRAGLQLWLHSLLGCEPPSVLLEWLCRETNGLPASVHKQLTFLVERGILRKGECDWILDKEATRLALGERLGVHKPTPPHNLPLSLTSFVGREREMWSVRRFLSEHRLITLLGPGGIGKTRLALELAWSLLSEFKDGVFFISFASINRPDLVASLIAETLGVEEGGGQALLDRLKNHLRHKQILLVLDNFERVLGAAASVSGVVEAASLVMEVVGATRLIAEILAAAPAVKMVVTSREALHVYGEHEYAVQPLAFPNLQRLPPTERLSRYPSIALFVQRAQAVQPDFRLADHNARAVAEICAHLDGLPLAIELAAARSKLFSPQAMALRLTHRLALLTGGPRDWPARQQTLRGTIDWSYELLEASEKALLARLAVFAGGFTLEAAEQVAKGERRESRHVESSVLTAEGRLSTTYDRLPPVFDGIASLVNKSLLVQDKLIESESHFRMLETIREYALEQLEASGEAEELCRRHAEYYLGLAEQAEANLCGPQQGAWLERLEIENDNLRAALEWTLEARRQECQGQGPISEIPTLESTIGLRLAGALWQFWLTRGYLSEGRRWLDKVLAENHGASSALRANGLRAAGNLAYRQGDYASAQSFYEETLTLFQELGDQEGIARSLNYLGIATLNTGNPTLARSLHEKSLAIWKKVGNERGTAISLNNLGEVARYQNDHMLARSLYEASLALFREWGDGRSVAIALNNLGSVLLSQNDLVTARALFEESMTIKQQLGDKLGIAYALDALADLAIAQGQLKGAACLFGAAESLCESIHSPLEPIDRAKHDRSVATVRACLDEATLGAAWAEGQAMTMEQAIALALGMMEKRKQADTAPSRLQHAEPARSATKEQIRETQGQPGPPTAATPVCLSVLETCQAKLRVFGLGLAQVYRGEQALTTSDWTRSRARQLLFYLLCQPPRTKEQIGLVFWPEASPAQLHKSFHITLYHLRRALGRSDWIVCEHQHYAFNRSLGYWFDAEAFEAKSAEAKRFLTDARPPATANGLRLSARAIPHLEEAIKLYRGDFLEDMPHDDWILARREEMRRLYLDALMNLGQEYMYIGRYAPASDAYRRVLDADSYNEAAHRGLMRCCAHQGERGQALRQYQGLAELLRVELGTAPAAETTALYEQLRHGEDG